MSKPAGGEASNGLSPDFLDFIVCLSERHVDFVLVAGYFMGVHGVVCATGDIDFLFRRTARNVHALCAAMNDFGAPLIDFVGQREIHFARVRARSAFYRVSDEHRAELPRLARRNGLREEDPHVRAVTRPRSLKRRTHALLPARVEIRERISTPLFAVKVRRKEPTRLVVQKRRDAGQVHTPAGRC
jgi:hypothetical protein